MSFAEGTPTVEITLGGKAYTLGWTWAAKRRLNERLKAQGADLRDASALADNLPAVLWAALDKEARESLSVEDVEELVNPVNEVQVVEKIGALFVKSEPDPEVKANPAAVMKPTAGSSTSKESAPLLYTT